MPQTFMIHRKRSLLEFNLLKGVWKKLIPTLMDDFEESFSGESDYRCGEIARELEVELEDRTEPL